MADATEALSIDSAARTLRRFFAWWSGELASLLPLALRPGAQFLDQATFVEIEGKRVRLKRYRGGRLQDLDALDLAQLPAAEQPLELRAWLGRSVAAPDALALILHPGDALVRHIHLPHAAEENLRQALAFELNRYTPFQANEVYFDYRLAQGATGGRELSLQIAVAPRTRVDPALSLLVQAGARPAAVVLGDDLRAECLPLNLLPPERRPKRAPRISASNTALAALAVILAGIALSLPVWQKQQAIAALTPLVERARGQAEGASRLRTELDALVQTHDFLLQRKHGYPAATVVIDELTRVLPDGTWLQQLSLRSHPKGWEIQIQGETTISSRLARVIDDSPLFRDAGFKSPLIKGQAPASERFNLGAELESVPAPKPQRVAGERSPAHSAAAPARAPQRLVARRP
ncbi:MAG: hypothetical protein IH606_01040 [Burkholderiales bacterium]|nr:hypothetical protein [Burkholderiales bacterium]